MITETMNSIDRVGRDGTLSLEYARREQHTLLTRFHFRNPLQVFPSTLLDDEVTAYTQILNPTGGLVGGDHLRIWWWGVIQTKFMQMLISIWARFSF